MRTAFRNRQLSPTYHFIFPYHIEWRSRFWCVRQFLDCQEVVIMPLQNACPLSFILTLAHFRIRVAKHYKDSRIPTKTSPITAQYVARIWDFWWTQFVPRNVTGVCLPVLPLPEDIEKFVSNWPSCVKHGMNSMSLKATPIWHFLILFHYQCHVVTVRKAPEAIQRRAIQR